MKCHICGTNNNKQDCKHYDKKTGYTPGPWKIHEGADYIHIYGGEYDHSENPLATVSSLENAKLMAMAPELLKALQRVLNCPAMNLQEIEGEDWKAEEYALKIIKKATEG